MKQQDLINRLRDELAHVVVQTEGNAAIGLTDHNKIAENLMVVQRVFALYLGDSSDPVFLSSENNRAV